MVAENSYIGEIFFSEPSPYRCQVNLRLREILGVGLSKMA